MPRRAAAFLALCLVSGTALADDMTTTAATATATAEPPTPRLKLSFRRFTVAGVEETSPVELAGAQLDAYAVSERWLRIGAELEGGVGSASFAALTASVTYGLVGVTAGVQLPGRI